MDVYAVKAGSVPQVDGQGDGFDAEALEQPLVQIAGAVGDNFYWLAHIVSSSFSYRPRLCGALASSLSDPM